jgi:hypothetical protein
MLVLVSACGVVGGGPTDPELVDATLAEWRDAVVAGDIDHVLATYSEEFACFDAPSREAMRELMIGLRDQGALRGVEVFLDRAEKEETGDTIRVFPVEMIGPNANLTVFRLTLREEGGRWLISGQEW